MAPISDKYDNVARVYIQVVNKDSPDAAVALEKIQVLAGSHAAFRATLILTLLKTEVQQHRFVPNLSQYVYLLNAFPEAFPLLEQALDHCLHAWHLQDVTVSLKNGNPPFYPSERLLSAR
jgi:hypothetical protein